MLKSALVGGVFIAAILAGLAIVPPPPSRSTVLTVPVPDGGSVKNGAYVNAYFDLTYPLPSGWTQGLAGPAPSRRGYYVLSALETTGKLSASTLITGQDMFFAAERHRDAIAMAESIGRAMAAIDGMTIDRPASQVSVAGRQFGRVDFRGVGLLRSVWVTQIRCHLLTFNFTAKSAETLATLVESLGQLTSAYDPAIKQPAPACDAAHARPENVLSRTDPPAIAPFYWPIPVRIIVSANGSVKHVHVIRATAEQKKGIEGALRRWTFKPKMIRGRAAEVETGLLLKFNSAGKVEYLTANASAGSTGRPG